MPIRDLIAFAAGQLRLRFLESILIVLAMGMGMGVLGIILTASDIWEYQEKGIGANTVQRAIRVAKTGSVMTDKNNALIPMGTTGTKPKAVSLDMLERIRKSVNGVKYAYTAGIHYRIPIRLVEGHPTLNTPSISIIGTTPDFIRAMGLPFEYGSSFTDRDLVERRRVLVIGGDAVRKYFPGEPPSRVIGKSIQTHYAGDFTVIGVLGHIPSGPNEGELSGMDGGRPDSVVIAPVTSLPDPTIFELCFLSDGVDNDRETKRQIRVAVDRLYGGGLSVYSYSDGLYEQRERNRRTIRILRGAGSISMIIACLNVLNLLLARVMKREKHIALSKALGASQRVVACQVLAESLLLSLGGTILGLLMAMSLSSTFPKFILTTGQGTATAAADFGLSPMAALNIVAIGIMTGLFFGWYPALVASRVEPAESMKV